MRPFFGGRSPRRKIPFLVAKPIGQHGKQQMSRQMQWWLASEYTRPARAQSFAIEIAQMRDLVFQRSLGRRLGGQSCSPHGIGDPIETSAFGCRRYQIEAEFLANDAGEKAAHRVLLPSRGMHHGIDAYATRCA